MCAVLVAAVGCSTSSAAGVVDAAAEAEAAAVSDGAPVEAGDDGACTAAGGRCVLTALTVVGHARVAECEFENSEACGPGAVCCLDMICAPDATAPIVQASDYDQDCAVDSDCVEIHVGNACSCDFSCALSPAAINMSALPEYTADVAKLPRLSCGCPPPPPPLGGAAPMACCVGGQCQTVTGQCSGPADGGPGDGGAE